MEPSPPPTGGTIQTNLDTFCDGTINDTKEQRIASDTKEHHILSEHSTYQTLLEYMLLKFVTNPYCSAGSLLPLSPSRPS